ncbi:MAG: class I SAM-dependent methyltransferase [Candidatus Omnitrophica bacterium]|nr:class I SAM-dependent methyltransferase [Candidatus Omnitrophota bacterium]
MQSPFEKYRLRLLDSLFDSSISGVVLDIGCNIGGVAKIYKNNIKKAVLMDKDSFLLKCAGHFNDYSKNLSFVCGDLVNLPFRDFSFDNIILTEVIEHTSKEVHKKILREILRIGKNGCTIFISTPNRLSLPALEGRFIKIFLKNYVWNAWDNTHQYVYTSREFIKFLSLSNLCIKKWFGYYFLPGSLLIRLPKRLQQILGYFSYLVSKYLGELFPFKYLGFSTIVELQKVGN